MDRSDINDHDKGDSSDTVFDRVRNRGDIRSSDNQMQPILKGSELSPTCGFGIIFAQNDEGLLYVHSLVPGSPASLSKPEICVGDILCSIDSISVYKHDLLFVAKCMAVSVKERTVFGFYSNSELGRSCDRSTIKKVVLERNPARKEPYVEGSICADTLVQATVKSENGSPSRSFMIPEMELSINRSGPAGQENASSDAVFLMANKLRDQGSYADAIKLYRKILGDFAANHQVQ